MRIVVSHKKIHVRLEHQQQIFTLISLCFELSSSSSIPGYYQFCVVVRDVLPLPFLGLSVQLYCTYIQTPQYSRLLHILLAQG